MNRRPSRIRLLGCAAACLSTAALAQWPAPPDVDLRIPLDPRVLTVEYVGWTEAHDPGWGDAGAGSDLRFALAPGQYRLSVTLYDSTAPEHKDDKLAVSFNGHSLGVFQRGAANGWSLWHTTIPRAAFASGPTQTLHFARAGKPLAVQNVRITVSRLPDPPPPLGHLERTGWNLSADHFMYAPTFSVAPVTGARTYVAHVQSDAANVARTVRSRTPAICLAAVWEALPPGYRYLAWLEAGDATGQPIGRTAAFEFRKVDSFRGNYRPARCGYLESGSQCAEYLMNTLRDWRAPPTEEFPALFYTAYIRLLVTYARLHPHAPRAAEALALAERFGQQLIRRSYPSNWAYGGLPRSHDSSRFTTPRNTMLQVGRTAMVGQAYLDLLVATGRTAYRDAAMKIADRLKATQLPAGGWYWRVDPQTGAAYVDRGGKTNDYTSDQGEAILLLDELATHYDRQDLAATRDRAVQWMLANPVKTHYWQNQWDDIGYCPPYANLEFYDTGLFAIYLARHATWRNGYGAIAEDLGRWIEDQFVLWENSYDPRFITPGVLEQYAWRFTIDWHSAHYIQMCLALHQATGKKIYLEKARALADTLTAVQRADGVYPTYLRQTAPGPAANTLGPIDFSDQWPNCMSYDAETLMKLGTYLKRLAGNPPSPPNHGGPGRSRSTP